MLSLSLCEGASIAMRACVRACELETRAVESVQELLQRAGVSTTEDLACKSAASLG
jgi:hypothetical protein